MWRMKNQPVRGRLIQRLPKKIQRLLRQVGALADEQGVALYLVGGVVRDLILKRENWDLDLTFANHVPDANGDGASLFTALEEQLGLKLESGRARVDVIGIDERPTPDYRIAHDRWRGVYQARASEKTRDVVS